MACCCCCCSSFGSQQQQSSLRLIKQKSRGIKYRAFSVNETMISSPASSSAVLVMDTFRRPSLLTKLPKFTREQVLANDHRNWIIVGGLVFDLTDFVKIHPGGDEVLLEFMGMDATSVFEDMHNAHAKLVLLKYVIGRVVEVKAGPTAMQQHTEQRRNSRIRSSTESLHSISSIESLEERSP